MFPLHAVTLLRVQDADNEKRVPTIWLIACFRITLTATNKIYILFTVTTLTTTYKSYSCVVKQNLERVRIGECIFFIKKLHETL
jgi:hypothetical protein